MNNDQKNRDLKSDIPNIQSTLKKDSETEYLSNINGYVDEIKKIDSEEQWEDAEKYDNNQK